jgi:Calpain family cysteine protease
MKNCSKKIKSDSQKGSISHPLSTHTSPFFSLLWGCNSSQKKFSDPDFPPSEKSLYGPFPPAEKPFGEVTWIRLSKFYQFSKLKLSKKSLNPNDICQGLLGNCYFVSALCALTKTPRLIKFLFENEEANEWGVYSIWLNFNGSWTNYIVDDYVPIDKKNNRLLFSSSASSQLWVPLLEKAYAKAYGGYLPIQGGDPASAFLDLTGGPVEVIPSIHAIDDLEGLWEKMKVHCSKEEIITCWTSSYSSSFLSPSHAYLIHLLHEVSFVENSMLKIVNLINPWGLCDKVPEKYRPNSKYWPKEVRKSISLSAPKKSFFLNFYDFCTNFQGLTICKRNSEEKRFNSDMVQGKSSQVWEVLVEKSTWSSFNIIQKDAKSFKQLNDYRYSFKRAYLLQDTQTNRKEGPNTEESCLLIDAVFDSERSIHVGGYLNPGKYLVIVEVYWDCNEPEKMLFLQSCSDSCLKLSKKEGVDINHIVCQGILGLVSCKKNDFALINHKLGTEGIIQEARMVQSRVKNYGFYFLAILNESKNAFGKKIVIEECSIKGGFEVIASNGQIFGEKRLIMDLQIKQNELSWLWVKINPTLIDVRHFVPGQAFDLTYSEFEIL